MSETIELTEEVVETMYTILAKIKVNIESEETHIQEFLNTVGNVGKGSIDEKLYELLLLKKQNNKLHYDVVKQYTLLWDQIVSKYFNIEYNLSNTFTHWEEKNELET